MGSKLPKTIYYEDLLNDEFSTMKIETPYIGEKYKYLRNDCFGKIIQFLSLNIIAKPIAFFYLKFKFKHKIIGKDKLKEYKKKAYFIYGNHTQIVADALIPAFIVRPRYFKVIVHPNNTKIPFIGKFVPYLGGLPLPSDFKATRNFLKAINVSVEEKHQPIFIYPEAHLWPYYTKIRPFVDTSFRYPYKYNTPVFCFTNTYHKCKNKNKVQIITYIDGPFFPNLNLSEKENKEKLRNEVYDAMVKRSSCSDKEVIKYIKKEKTSND